MYWLFILIPLVVIVWLATAIYNRLVRLRNTTDNALAQIDVQLKRRYELIPNLVEVARKYLQHETDTLKTVIAARNQADNLRQQWQKSAEDATTANALMQAEAALQSGLGRLMAVVESYPELKADETIHDLSNEITHTENRVSFARQAYNDAVLSFNNAAQSFPANIVANLFGFAPLAMLQSTSSDAERATLRVDMG